MVWKHDTVIGTDGKPRCGWASADPLYEKYHDTEWGRPLRDDRALFELLTLEGCQAGLSWITVLRKREHYRKVYDGFDPAKIARYTPAKLAKLLADPGIIRHRGKIEAVLHNARLMPALIAREGSLARFVWSFEPGAGSRPEVVTAPWLLANTTSTASVAMAKALKRHGWRFVGPTTAHAFMQSMGLFNDHLEGCHARAAVEAARAALSRPKSPPPD